MLSYTIVFFVRWVHAKDCIVRYIIGRIKKGWNSNSLDFDHAPSSTEATHAALRLLLHPATAFKAQAMYRIDIVRVWFYCSELNLKECQSRNGNKLNWCQRKSCLIEVGDQWSHSSDAPLLTSPWRLMLEDCQIVNDHGSRISVYPRIWVAFEKTPPCYSLMFFLLVDASSIFRLPPSLSATPWDYCYS